MIVFLNFFTLLNSFPCVFHDIYNLDYKTIHYSCKLNINNARRVYSRDKCYKLSTER